ncbi:MAG: hypothetical protein RIQ53_438 [Pseudomonadota bacterium]|jgi:hypothetical protein
MNALDSTLAYVAAGALAFGLAAGPAAAASTTLSGDLGFHNSVVLISFDVADSGAVSLWTDSWQSGLNVDPLLSLFSADGTLIEWNDDDAAASAERAYDAGLSLALAAGSYRLTLTASLNAPVGSTLDQGFAHDAETPVAVPLWNQPSYDLNLNDQKGTFWRVTLDGVQQAAVVPEPQSAVLLAAGLLAVGLRLQRQRRAG